SRMPESPPDVCQIPVAGSRFRREGSKRTVRRVTMPHRFPTRAPVAGMTDRRSLPFGALFHRAVLPALTERGVDQTDVTIGLRKVAQHAAGQRIEFFREQAHVIAAREQTLE